VSAISADDSELDAFLPWHRDSRPIARIFADAFDGREKPRHLAVASGRGHCNRQRPFLAKIPQAPSPYLKDSWTAPSLGRLVEAIWPFKLISNYGAKLTGMTLIRIK
jgi:hypothetical protein